MIATNHLTEIFISLTENKSRNGPCSLRDPRRGGNRAGLSTAEESPWNPARICKICSIFLRDYISSAVLTKGRFLDYSILERESLYWTHIWPSFFGGVIKKMKNQIFPIPYHDNEFYWAKLSWLLKNVPLAVLPGHARHTDRDWPERETAAAGIGRLLREQTRLPSKGMAYNSPEKSLRKFWYTGACFRPECTSFPSIPFFPGS